MFPFKLLPQNDCLLFSVTAQCQLQVVLVEPGGAEGEREEKIWPQILAFV